MKPQLNYNESDITIGDHTYKLKLIMNDEHLNITVVNNRSKCTFHNSYSHSDILIITRQAGFSSNMTQLYDMLIASITSITSTTSIEQKKEINIDLNLDLNLDLNITIENTEDKQEQKMVLELILVFNGKLNRVYRYVFELLEMKRNMSEILDDVLDDSYKLSDRVDQLEKLSNGPKLEELSNRIAKLEKLLKTNCNLVDTNSQIKEKVYKDEHEIEYNRDILIKAENGFIWNCRFGYLDVAKSLYSPGNVDIHTCSEAFGLSCANGRLAVAQWLYSLGNVDIHANNEYAFTQSCINGHLPVAQWLYSLGDVNIHIGNNWVFIKSFSTAVLKWLNQLK